MDEQFKTMDFLAKVDSQNRITINKNVRDLLGIKPGVKVRANISVIRV